ncbi:uncharacterized protein LOC132203965 [Neocloeon triangulifer]|uniref:uncharacterized protein LOC132203965 n=1 Tax=Neocloeon triangulifer TaxID=2078957 RepID=UPI00286F6E5F|nr:uncharacterized protein LOC132203965 [Neocloeon triangulifer]
MARWSILLLIICTLILGYEGAPAPFDPHEDSLSLESTVGKQLKKLFQDDAVYGPVAGANEEEPVVIVRRERRSFWKKVGKALKKAGDAVKKAADDVWKGIKKIPPIICRVPNICSI